MADNVPITDADDAIRPIASDDVGGVQFQKVKLDVGGDGVSVPFTDPATAALQSSGNTTLTAILAKLLTAPATEAAQLVGNTSLATLLTHTDGLEAALAAILAKLTADPSTAAAQATGNSALATLVAQTDAVEGTLAAILAKIIAAPATEAAQTTGNTSLASINGKLPALVANRVPVGAPLPVVSAATILSATTDAGGTAWVAFGSQACTHLDLVNTSGTAIEYRRGGAGVGLPIPAGSARLIAGLTNADQISVRRVDLSATVATVHAEALS